VFKLPLKFSLLFLVLFFVQLLGELNPSSWFSMYTESLTATALTLLFAGTTRLRGRFHRRILFGFLTLIVGRVCALFMAPGLETFLSGMICCAIAYIFFVSAFYLDFRSAPELDKKGARFSILVALIFSLLIYLYLRPFLGVYRIPILIYTFLMSLMVMMASFRRLRVNSQSFVLVLLGIGVWIVSDFLFAVDKFVSPFEAAHYLVGGTRVLALYLIVAGAATRVLQPSVSPF
jgi:uncharacterized membrane protein YhhN